MTRDKPKNNSVATSSDTPSTTSTTSSSSSSSSSRPFKNTNSNNSSSSSSSSSGSSRSSSNNTPNPLQRLLSTMNRIFFSMEMWYLACAIATGFWIYVFLGYMDYPYWYEKLTGVRPTVETHGALTGFKKFGLWHMLSITITIFLWQRPIAKRLMMSWVYCFFCLTLMSFSSNIGWFRNPNHMGHIPDLVHESMGVPLEFVTFPYTAFIRTFLFQTFGTTFFMGGAVFTEGGGGSVLGAPVGDWQMNAVHLIEFIMLGLMYATVIWCLTQPWRWLALRRIFAVQGTLALMRSITVLVTNVPDSRPFCHTETPGTTSYDKIPWDEVWERTFELATLGDTLTCGDMVYSGHTVLMAVCGMGWHTYYKVITGTFSVNIVKTTIWAMIFVALFLIIATRLHYTLDVLLGLYLTITMWGAYHRAADDVLVGHRYIAVYIVDGLILYPAITWLEGPHLGEAAAAGMISKHPRSVSKLSGGYQVQWAAHIAAQYFADVLARAADAKGAAAAAAAVSGSPAHGPGARGGVRAAINEQQQNESSDGSSSQQQQQIPTSPRSTKASTSAARFLSAMKRHEQSSPPFLRLPRASFGAEEGQDDDATTAPIIPGVGGGGGSAEFIDEARAVAAHVFRTRSASEAQASAELVADLLTALAANEAALQAAAEATAAASLAAAKKSKFDAAAAAVARTMSPARPTGVEVAAAAGILRRLSAGFANEFTDMSSSTMNALPGTNGSSSSSSSSTGTYADRKGGIPVFDLGSGAGATSSSGGKEPLQHNGGGGGRSSSSSTATTIKSASDDEDGEFDFTEVDKDYSASRSGLAVRNFSAVVSSALAWSKSVIGIDEAAAAKAKLS